MMGLEGPWAMLQRQSYVLVGRESAESSEAGGRTEVIR